MAPGAVLAQNGNIDLIDLTGLIHNGAVVNQNS